LGGTGPANTARYPDGGRSGALRPPTFGVQLGSAALCGAGLAVRLAVLVAGLLPATGLLALPVTEWVTNLYRPGTKPEPDPL